MAKQSEATKQYKKQLRRIKRFITQASRRGFEFDFEIPKTPKKITSASVRKLQKITPEYLYKKATYFVEDTGEYISGLKGRKYERSLAGQKAYIHRINREATQQTKDKTGVSSKPKVNQEIVIPPPEQFSYDELPDRSQVTIDFTMKETFEYVTEIIQELTREAQEIGQADERYNRLRERKIEAREAILYSLTLDTKEKYNRAAQALVEYQAQVPMSNAIQTIIRTSSIEEVEQAEQDFLTALNSGKPLTQDMSAELNEAIGRL